MNSQSLHLAALLAFFIGLNAHALINGEVVQANDPLAKSTVALIFKEANGRYYCSGSIIDESHVITAAHCVEDAFIEGTIVFASEHVFAKDQPSSNLRTISGFQMGNGFPGGRALPFDEINDLAIVEFKGGLPNGYAPIPYIAPELYSAFVKTGATVTAAGFGKYTRASPPDGSLRKGSASVVAMSLEKINFWTTIGGCGGDSGGPATIELNGSPILIGIFSRTDPDCKSVSIYSKFAGDLNNGREKQ